MSVRPLADLIRPKDFDEMIGQEKLVGKNGVLRKMIDSGRITNMIFFGPPGTGKTTAAKIIAERSNMELRELNATTASLADVKAVISETSTMFGSRGILLYLDEIQYFNKKQQQSLLEFIEDGRITLIASTTENPYFYVYNAIISRSAVFEFKPVSSADTAKGLRRAFDMLNEREGKNKSVSDETLLHIASLGAGDVRRSIGIVENAYYAAEQELTIDTVSLFAERNIGNFDREGDVHYDLLSALQKSIRGSDPDAAVFYLAKLLEGGDIISACRRLLVIANEDIGLAYPLAAVVTKACCDTARELGMPEARLALANAAVLLATSPKSNTAHNAIIAASEDVAKGLGQEIPTILQSPFFKGYKYPHEYKNHYVKQEYLPDDIKGKKYYEYGDNRTEQAAKAYWDQIKNENKQEK
ncbi:MAG: replication-associated recombination protein A [Clostridia bacterium]|nr:replication-associated recombination protein A [Clostridia bacterium]